GAGWQCIFSSSQTIQMWILIQADIQPPSSPVFFCRPSSLPAKDRKAESKQPTEALSYLLCILWAAFV
ncbi:MAG: hypothetical protein ACK5XN_35660, partial [Bacteroidota bacterium]